MSGLRVPTTKPLADAEIVAADETPTRTKLARLITARETGSQILFGLCWLDPDQVSESWSLADDLSSGPAEQEVYYVLKGEIEVKWDEGTLVAGPETAVYLPPGWTYRVTGVSRHTAMFAYAYVPAPV
jgi:ethanolamine utilization protein EutQ (cupin superfamily)